MKLEQKLYQLFNANPEITSRVGLSANGTKCIHIGQHNPVDSAYPQLTYVFEESTSEEVLPAKRGTLYIRYFLDESASQPFKQNTTMCDIIEGMINKRPTVFEDVSYGDNRGLHVNRCVKTVRITSEFMQDIKKHVAYLVFDIVMSDEFMNYNSNNGEELKWP